MNPTTLQIELKKEKTPPPPGQASRNPSANKTKKKTRQFTAILLGYVNADSVWQGGVSAGETNRPVWSMLAGTEQQLRAFCANLQIGNRAEIPHEITYSREATTKFEWLRSVGYRYIWQRITLDNHPEPLAVVQIYLPDLCRLDPGMIDPQVVKFICLTPTDWQQQQLLLLTTSKPKLVQEILRHAYALKLHDWPQRYKIGKDSKQFHLPFSDQDILATVPQAAYFAAYLDKRTQKPLLPDSEFHLQLYFYALQKGLATLPTVDGSVWDWEREVEQSQWGWAKHQQSKFHESNLEACGLLPGVQFNSSQEQLDAFLAEQIELYHDTKTYGNRVFATVLPSKVEKAS